MASSAENRQQSNRHRYGQHLKRLREAKGLTQVELGQLLAMSPSMIAHIEAGRRIPQRADAIRLDEVLDGRGFFTEFLPTLGVIPAADHFAEALEWEQLATSISEYAVSLVPGLLQTKDYAYAVLRVLRPNYTPSEVDGNAVNRLRRAEILVDPATPTLWFILNENVIKAQVGGREVMAQQLRHIAGLGRSGRIGVQVVPHAVGAHATMGSMLSLMRFTDAPDLAYVEALYTGNLIDDPLMVQNCKDAYDLARAAAMPPDASLDLLEEVAEEYDHEL
ncbi:helix-turn-helix transcriptional regulator [Streptomyces sp. NPDC004610]|uniref:helix-turn-helix domain-containing protein n=1 Tax=unclassified Streptomyces TaxID=2593676 RepID=UPI00339F0377